MATYNFLNKKTGEYGVTHNFDLISEAEEWFAANPDLEWLPSSLGIVDPWRVGRAKPSSGFRDVLKDIKRRYPKSDINTF